MTATDFIVICIGILSSSTLVISALSLHRWRLLLFGIITSILVTLQYGLVGAWSGLIVLIIGLIRTTMALASLRYPKLTHWGWTVSFILIYLIAILPTINHATAAFFDYIPIIAGIAGVIAVTCKKIVYTKIIFMLSSAIWLIYQYTNGVYGQMIGESLNLVANAASIATLAWAARRGVPAEELDDVDKTIIDTITESIPVLREYVSTITNSTTAVHAPTRGAHPQSVAYSRWVEEHEKKVDDPH